MTGSGNQELKFDGIDRHWTSLYRIHSFWDPRVISFGNSSNKLVIDVSFDAASETAFVATSFTVESTSDALPLTSERSSLGRRFGLTNCILTIPSCLIVIFLAIYIAKQMAGMKPIMAQIRRLDC
jgi:hypothetical protein